MELTIEEGRVLVHPFDTLAEVEQALDALTDRVDPLVARLERQPGQKEARYGQLLVDVQEARARPRSETAPPHSPTLVGLAREVEMLRGEVAELRTQVDRLRAGAGGVTAYPTPSARTPGLR